MNTTQVVAVSLAASLLSGCATAGARLQSADRARSGAAQAPADAAVLAEYVQKLPLGSKVRVDRVKGGAVTGTLMKATSDVVIVQRHTRVPEPQETIPLAQVLAVTPQVQSSVGRAIGAGAAAGAGAAVGVILLLIALWGD